MSSRVRWPHRAALGIVPSNYRIVWRNSSFRRLALGAGISNLGDSISSIATPWLALQLAAPSQEALAVGAAASLNFLPGLLGAALFRRFPLKYESRTVAITDAWLRLVALGSITVAYYLDRLNLPIFLLLIAVSSLLHPLGVGAQRTLTARVTKPQERLHANGVINTQVQISLIMGPVIAGLLIPVIGSAAVMGIDAITFAAIPLAFRGLPRTVSTSSSPREQRGSLKTLLRYPQMATLLGLTFAFFLLYGPLPVAIPLLIRDQLGGDAGALGIVWTSFGIGALTGGYLLGFLKSLNPLRTAVGVVGAWGLVVVAMSTAPGVISLAVFMALGGLVFSPYNAVTAAYVQNEALPEDLASVNTAWATTLVAASPLGVALSGPLVAAVGAKHSLLLSGVTTLVLGAIAALAMRPRERR